MVSTLTQLIYITLTIHIVLHLMGEKGKAGKLSCRLIKSPQHDGVSAKRAYQVAKAQAGGRRQMSNQNWRFLDI